MKRNPGGVAATRYHVKSRRRGGLWGEENFRGKSAHEGFKSVFKVKEVEFLTFHSQLNELTPRNVTDTGIGTKMN